MGSNMAVCMQSTVCAWAWCAPWHAANPELRPSAPPPRPHTTGLVCIRIQEGTVRFTVSHEAWHAPVMGFHARACTATREHTQQPAQQSEQSSTSMHSQRSESCIKTPRCTAQSHAGEHTSKHHPHQVRTPSSGPCAQRGVMLHSTLAATHTHRANGSAPHPAAVGPVPLLPVPSCIQVHVGSAETACE